MRPIVAFAGAAAALVMTSAGDAFAGVPTQIPEPSSLALIAGAAAAVAWARFRKRN